MSVHNSIKLYGSKHIVRNSLTTFSCDSIYRINLYMAAHQHDISPIVKIILTKYTLQHATLTSYHYSSSYTNMHHCRFSINLIEPVYIHKVPIIFLISTKVA